MLGDIVTLDDYDKQTNGKEFEVVAYKHNQPCQSRTMVSLGAIKGKQTLTLDRVWCVFVRSGVPWHDDIPF